jgi:hypothetical protein
MMLTAALLVSLRLAAPQQPAIDYGAYFARGVAFAEFLAGAQMLADEWRDTYAQASLDEETLTRARALTHARRLLVVADDSCHDSLATLPYIARLVEAVPEMLSMRIVSSAAGQPIKEAHLTPDGRAATPTIVVIDERGAATGVFIERPAALLRYIDEHGTGHYPGEVRVLRQRWYADDKGRHALGEILDLLAK